MKNNTIEGMLNKIKWLSNEDELRRYEVVILDRGETSGTKVIRLGGDVKILRDRLIVGESTIPMHRVIEIRKDGEALWRRNASLRS